jgi:serine phosphatase RsbU (regulator of sigma subunit)
MQLLSPQPIDRLLSDINMLLFDLKKPEMFSASPTQAAPGDLFVILTDGLTEVFDEEDRDFGLDRVKDIVSENATLPLERLQDMLLFAVRQHGPQLDDQTVLLIRACD